MQQLGGILVPGSDMLWNAVDELTVIVEAGLLEI